MYLTTRQVVARHHGRCNTWKQRIIVKGNLELFFDTGPQGPIKMGKLGIAQTELRVGHDAAIDSAKASMHFNKSESFQNLPLL